MNCLLVTALSKIRVSDGVRANGEATMKEPHQVFVCQVLHGERALFSVMGKDSVCVYVARGYEAAGGKVHLCQNPGGICIYVPIAVIEMNGNRVMRQLPILLCRLNKPSRRNNLVIFFKNGHLFGKAFDAGCQ